MEHKDLNNKPGFYTRGFTSFLIALTFLSLFVSGVVLYVTPRGRTANWTGWSMMGLEKEQWGSLHINIALLFLLITALHLFFNWKVLLNYIRSRRSTGFRRGKELFASVAVITLFSVGTVLEWQPFNSVLTWHEDIKDYWDQNSPSAPVAHAEDLTLKEFATYVNLSEDQLANRLKEKGLVVASLDERMGDLAQNNNIEPVQVYQALQVENHNTSNTPTILKTGLGGSGYGWMTINDLCTREGLQLEDTISKLKTMGVTASADNKLRDLATALNTTPGTLVSKLTGNIIMH